ncbi:ead/Ea22-like family protein [Escherichia coli]|nr:ead/Ea22-like family protein [Escherichia coli]EIL1643743.1 ead/Ea22-like family protein [Escherichia coli]EKV7418072.1 ead/Ea22-like family protein [Escherichia coli]ELF2593086.1 ead/Ea22-like family protein [Escherichia coli]ELJ0142445.1 ead/Ea22-like family protein [Escherichia coli]ELM1691628.1 ead/Ea22-like family protein [Escherichia coli]
MSNIDKRALRHSAESIICILENIAGFEPSDIDGDSVELRFETEDGFDTGCDVSIVDQCQKTADVVRALLDELERNQQYIKSRDQENEEIALTVGKLRVELEAAEKRIAELELREVVLPQCYSMLHRVDFDEPYHTEMVYRQHQVLEALHNAGINVTEAGKGEAS